MVMGLFTKGNLPTEEVKQLRTQGMSDNQIIDELKSKNFSLTQINDALAQSAIASPDLPAGGPPEGMPGGTMPPVGADMGPPGMEAPGGEAIPETPSTDKMGEDMYGRIEEIAEGIIDEKWDSLIEEVKKIIEWKEGVEGTIQKIHGDVDKLKEDFKELHQGVLGKLETYDNRMTEVGTELKAVGKVFKDVVPEFVENVKELKGITKIVKKKK